MSEINLERLKEPFAPSEIEWRVGVVNKDRMSCIALPYITNRAVQNRLDDVCGAGNWWNEYKAWGENGQLCGITILIDGRPVTKWDGAENTQIDPTKGGLSNSMKRAAAQWGIGRYLYDLPTFYANVKAVGKGYRIIKPPELPISALPKGFKGKQNFAEGDNFDDRQQTLESYLNNNMPNKDTQISEEDAQILEDILLDYESRGMLTIDSVLQYFGVDSVYKLTEAMRVSCYETLNKKDKVEEKKKTAKK